MNKKLVIKGTDEKYKEEPQKGERVAWLWSYGNRPPRRYFGTVVGKLANLYRIICDERKEWFMYRTELIREIHLRSGTKFEEQAF